MSKYKYYFRKPRSEIAKDIIKVVAVAGLLAVASPSPQAIIRLWRSLARWHAYPKRQFQNCFSNLWRRGYLNVERQGYDLKISLTPQGKKAAGWLQIDSLKISRPKKWDGRWRVIIFDIAELKRRHRDAFRAKLKALGFKYIQKSVWLHPFDCTDEIGLLKDFFGLKEGSIIMLTALKIDEEKKYRSLFKIQPGLL